jgi:hypothetical protein
MDTNPLCGFFNTLFLFLSFRVKFHREDVGRIITMENGQTFRIFRHVKIKAPDAMAPQGVFIVRFRPLNMTVQQNIRFSLLPMLILMGFHGFREKFWCVDDSTGLCQGVYAWQTEQDAQNYANSIAMRFMTRRSDPLSVTTRVFSQKDEPFWLFQQYQTSETS